MNKTAQYIFKAVHEGKWLSIEYKNKKDEITNYWIAVHGIDVKRKALRVEGFHLTMHTIREYDCIYLDSILSSAVVEASTYKIEQGLVEDIERSPEKYEPLFGQAVNLKILNYLIDCNRLDTEAYECDYSLIRHLDGASFRYGEYPLSKEQFSQFVHQFQKESTSSEKKKIWQYRQLAMNELSILVNGRSAQREALYVLAYRKLYLDVKRRVLEPDTDITICREFTVNGERESIRKYMDPADYDLLEDFESNKELVKDRITRYNSLKQGVDDRPYIIALARNVKVDLNKEYEAVAKSLEEGKETYPIKAFFGKLTGKPVRRKDYPLALLERRANLDQLLAIHNAIKYPVTYVQGPPGTGKTHTIINSIVTAFFNEKTVLLASYNNHPIDTVVEKLRSIPYGADVLFIDDEDEKVKAFHEYLGKTENVKKFLRIFPVVATSCISSHRIGSPRPYFDITIMDEASQCSTAVSLLPVIRGENLLLVGDPQQLNPVILLDRKDNEILKQRYRIPPEYDYVENSVYKTFLANDAVSEEILLRHHYRCCKSIIEFNNVKYYNSRLKIESSVKADHPLVYVDVKGNEAGLKNTAPREAEEILKFIQDNRDKKIGIITPFANQKECIGQMLKDNKIDDVSCGTVHAFQGDEKDIILFSTALTDQTSEKTYHWLCNNRELFNVATSRAREKLVLFSSTKNLQRLHDDSQRDDMYELARYVSSNGQCRVTPDEVHSRALGIKPYSTQTEEDFLVSLNHALGNILNNNRKCAVRREVAISQVFQDNTTGDGLFYNGRFDFVIYEREYGGREMPILAIELDGKEHQEEELVRQRDRQKANICRQHGFELIRVENSYARRYYFIKEILEEYFRKLR